MPPWGVGVRRLRLLGLRDGHRVDGGACSIAADALARYWGYSRRRGRAVGHATQAIPVASLGLGAAAMLAIAPKQRRHRVILRLLQLFQLATGTVDSRYGRAWAAAVPFVFLTIARWRLKRNDAFAIADRDDQNRYTRPVARRRVLRLCECERRSPIYTSSQNRRSQTWPEAYNGTKAIQIASQRLHACSPCFFQPVRPFQSKCGDLHQALQAYRVSFTIDKWHLTAP